MALSIRLKRLGRTHLPFYSICVFPSLVRRDGNPVEELGLFNPAPKGKQEELRLDLERAKYWLSQGAKPSDIVAKIFRDNGLKGDLWARKPQVGKSKKTDKKAAKPAAKKTAKAAPKKASGDAATAAKTKKRKPRTASSKLTADRKRNKGNAAA